MLTTIARTSSTRLPSVCSRTRAASCKCVGFKDQQEDIDAKDIDGQRSVNVKYYLVEDDLGPKADGSRIQPKAGGMKGKATHFYFVPDGNLCQGQVVEGTAVDENAVKGQARAAKPPAKKKAKKAAAPPAQ